MTKSEEYVARAERARADIATWPAWMQRNLRPTTVTVPSEPVKPYWHKFRVHLDWRQDGEFPNDTDFYLVWHRRRRD